MRILPFVTDEDCFAIHGGTAINLFVKNLYRLSVDIDVTYIPIEDRNTSLKRINESLERIADKVRRRFRDVRVIPRLDISKITCESRGCQVKIEVNQTKRGLVCGEATLMPLCENAIHESFAPNLIDQHEVMERQFSGMSDIPFTYNDFEATREELVNDVNFVMTEEDKRFLIGFEELAVDWENTPYSSFKEYPSVRWNMQNLHKLKASNPKKLKAEADKLRKIFEMD